MMDTSNKWRLRKSIYVGEVYKKLQDTKLFMEDLWTCMHKHDQGMESHVWPLVCSD